MAFLMVCALSIQSAYAAIKDCGLKEYVYTSKDLPHSETNAWTLVCQLPYNAQFTPWIQVKADSAGQVIACDSSNPLARCRQIAQRYTTVSGDQSYEAPKWISGEGAIYMIPAGVTVVAVKYRETGYDTQVAGSFTCNDNDYSVLWQKATRTCYLCMRDSYMDCPDRERAEWLGDAVLEMEECFYAFDVSSHQMAKRFIRSGQVNGLPGQNLIAHGEYGDWTYYLYTGDLETLSLIYPKTKKYLDQYQLDQNGLPEHRKEGWDWYDWGTGHKDSTVIQVAEYYGAMSALRKMAQATGHADDIPAIDAKCDSVKKNFDRMFWKDDGYRSGKRLDERANAMAVCAGLAEPLKWPTIARILEIKRPGNGKGKMEVAIDRAMYGVQGDPGKQVDIRNTLQRLADAGEYNIRIDNELAGKDPASNVEKFLEIEYRLNGEKMQGIIGEREQCDLSGRGGQCGPYFERWVLEALCVMDRQEGALLRMAHRYRSQIDARFTTLWEYLERAFDIRKGTDSINYVTLNHAWNVPNTILSRFIAGVAPDSPGWTAYHVLPQEAFLTAIDVTVPTIQGQVAVSIKKTASQYRLSVASPANTTAIVGIPKMSFSELRSIEVNGTVVWNGAFTGNVEGLSRQGEDTRYVLFTVKPGTWTFIGSGDLPMATPKPPAVAKNLGVALNKKAWTVSASTDNQTFQAGPWGKIDLQVDACSARAIDGDYWTGWRALGRDQAPGQWFIIDMKQPQRFDTIIMDNVWAIYDAPAGYAISVSNDATNWGSPVVTGAGENGGITTVSCGDRTGRYIKIEQTGTKMQVWSIYEVDVYRASK